MAFPRFDDSYHDSILWTILQANCSCPQSLDHSSYDLVSEPLFIIITILWMCYKYPPIL